MNCILGEYIIMKKLGLKKVAVMAAAAFTVLGVATSASADTQSDLDAVKQKRRFQKVKLLYLSWKVKKQRLLKKLQL